jgi:hypothetical protein
MVQFKEFEELEKAILKNVCDLVIQEPIEDAWKYFSDPEFFHIVTPEIAEKIGDEFGDDYTDSIGRYAFLARWGEPISLEEFFKVEYLSGDSSGIDFRPIDSLEGYIKNGHFEKYIDYNGGIDHSTLSDILIYTILKDLEEQDRMTK